MQTIINSQNRIYNQDRIRYFEVDFSLESMIIKIFLDNGAYDYLIKINDLINYYGYLKNLNIVELITDVKKANKFLSTLIAKELHNKGFVVADDIFELFTIAVKRGEFRR